MPMTVIVTRDVAPRFRGFLASCAAEIAPGVYTNPRMSDAVRARVWSVLTEWFSELGGGAIVMTWRDARLPGGQGLETVGIPCKRFIERDGLVLTCLRSE